jgi:hypothetical protein
MINMRRDFSMDTVTAKNFNIADDRIANAYYSALHYLQSKVAGLMIDQATSPNPSITWRGERNSTAFYINEMRVDAAYLSATPMSDIAYIKVFPPVFLAVGGGGTGGAIAVYTTERK